MALCYGFAGKDAGDPFPKKESKKTPGNPAAAGLPPRNSRLPAGFAWLSRRFCNRWLTIFINCIYQPLNKNLL